MTRACVSLAAAAHLHLPPSPSNVSPFRPARPGAAPRHRRWACQASTGAGGAEEGSGVPDALPAVGGLGDWRTVRAALVAAESKRTNEDAEAGDVWAHGLPRPEQGCLLLSHPLYFSTTQTYFRDSVVWLFSHTSSGSAGLILNKPTQYKCSQVLRGAEQQTLLPAEFSGLPLYLGGDVGKATLHLVHGISGLKKSVEVIPGCFLGGWEDAEQRVRDGVDAPSGYKVIWQYAGWAASQLQEECERGVWLPVAASKDLILSQAAAATGAEQWHLIMTLVGGEHAELSAAMKETFRADIMGGAQVQQQPEEEDSAEGGGGSGENRESPPEAGPSP